MPAILKTPLISDIPETSVRIRTVKFRVPMRQPARYYKLSDYLKEVFPSFRVKKIPVEAGFSCPNRDGTLSSLGCIYCDNRSFSPELKRAEALGLRQQIERAIRLYRRRGQADKFIVYFQAYTNTYGDIARLKKAYDVVRQFDDVVGLSIATRPDCVDKEVLELIDSYCGDYHVWLELGLQSIHDKTLNEINRRHDYRDFLRSYELARQKKDIKVCVHLIVGLPGEERGMIMQTAKEMYRLRVDGVKLHPLQVIRGTALHGIFEAGGYSPMSMEEYSGIVAEFIGHLREKTVIHRLGADCPGDLLVTAGWQQDKQGLLRMIDEKLKENDIYQGKFSTAKEELCRR